MDDPRATDAGTAALPALPGLVALDLTGAPAAHPAGAALGKAVAADGPFAFHADDAASRAGLPPEPPAHRAGVVRTAGGLWLAGAVRLDARRELAAKLGLGNPDGAPGTPRWRADLALAAAAVERWGAAAGDHLLGDFSLCSWDPRERRFLAFRDPFGVLPLYLRRLGDALLLSTSHRLLRSLPPQLDEPDEATLADFLLFGESVEPAATGWRGLRAVPPGHLLRARLGAVAPGNGNTTGNAAAVEERRYYDFSAAASGPAARLGIDEAAEAFREVFDRAVADRRAPAEHADGGPAGAPVGVLASGGLDASLVAASLAAGSRDGARSYTYSYRRLVGDDSGDWARRVAGALGLPAEIMAADAHLPWDR